MYGVYYVMNFLEKILYFLQAHVDRPASYGIFHICWLVLTVAVTVFLVLRFRNASDKTVRRICLGVWLTIVVLEIYKQLAFSMHVTDGVVTWAYQWYIFPFQFCSSPLYALPFVIWLKNGRVRNAFITFMATFSIFGGLAVMLYPNDVFTTMGGINIQTMIHHGAQIAMGIFLFACSKPLPTFRRLLGGLAVFSSFSVVAIILNEVMFGYLTRKELTGEAFNMFYISPHYPCTLPLLSNFYGKIPYPAFLLIYLVGFALIAALILGAQIGIAALIRKCGKKQA